MPKSRLLKAVVLGDAGCGKTCLLKRFVSDEFEDHYRATIGASFLSKQIQVKSRPVTLQIWDTAGMERHNSLTRSFFMGSDCVLLVFDLTDRESFQHLGSWRQEFEQATNTEGQEGFPFVVLGNKSDLEDSREIQTEEAQAWCDRAGLPYFETSAKENTNVGEAFVRVVQRALESESAGKDPMSFDLDTYLPQLDEEEDDANLSPPTCCA